MAALIQVDLTAVPLPQPDQLPESVLAQAANMSASRQQLFLAGRSLLAAWMQTQYGCASLPALQVGAHGRPGFVDPNWPDFNLTHSGDQLWLVVGDGPLGLDIEVHRPRQQLDRLMAHVLSIAEQAWVAEQADPLAAFYQLWTLREAVLKANGRGLGALGQVTVHPASRQLATAAVPAGRIAVAQSGNTTLALYQTSENLTSPDVWTWLAGVFIPAHIGWSADWTVSSVV